MRVKLYAHMGRLPDVLVYDGDLPGYTDHAPPMIVLFNNDKAYVLADTYENGAEDGVSVYFDAATFHLIHTGKVC